jgi:hypothetical protein
MINILKLIIGIFLILLFGGCSKPDHSLTASKKARLVTELIINDSRCNSFKNRLVLPSIDDDAIYEIYHDAMKALCINKDI